MKKAIIFLSLLVAVSCLLSEIAHGFRINIDPPRVSLSVAPGKQKSSYITVSNMGSDQPMYVRAYLEDVVYLPDGTNEFLPIGSTPWSCGEWAQLRPAEFEIPPNREESVKITVKVPEGIEGGRYAVVFFETTGPTAKPKEGGTANISLRLGSILSVIVPGTEVYDAKLINFGVSLEEAEEEGKDIYKVSCTIFNQGNVLIRPKGSVKIIDSAEVKVAEISVNADQSGILPRTSQNFLVDIDRELAGGDYTAQVIIDYGGEELIAGQTSFSVKTKGQ
ncbi:MAG: hypothetical protein HQ593_01755 [Candidatus Omnitrophica bacterium]|nr:hypothetical protein [Candidatus Omnitrophota bacterium]